MGTRGFSIQWIGFNDHLYRKPFILLSIFFLSAFRFLNFPIFSLKKTKPLKHDFFASHYWTGPVVFTTTKNQWMRRSTPQFIHRKTRDGEFSRLDGAGFQMKIQHFENSPRCLDGNSPSWWKHLWFSDGNFPPRCLDEIYFVFL